MMITPATKTLDVLSVDECLELLKSRSLGRLAYVVGGKPRILPLNYGIHQGSVVFRTSYGDLLDNIHQQDVMFEIDHSEPSTLTGWSVIVHGIAEEIWRPEELDIVREFPLRPWAPGDRDHYVRILSSAITGRRIR
jgi:nitroimidazol reductase NimA-like FMN-containing flavoprotein (pyridoxamine 5'-phosphate oxidase superfamily)